jgi:hypothetical protein
MRDRDLSSLTGSANLIGREPNILPADEPEAHPALSVEFLPVDGH